MIGSQVDLEALSIAFFLFSCQIPLRGSHHRPIEESEHRQNAAQDMVEAKTLRPERIEHNPAGIQRHCHDQQHPPVQKQGVFGDALGVDAGGHRMYESLREELSVSTTSENRS